MCVLRFVHACGHIREHIYSTARSPDEMCICGRILTQDSTDDACGLANCHLTPPNAHSSSSSSSSNTTSLVAIHTQFEPYPIPASDFVPSSDLSLEEQLAVLDAERHQLNVQDARIRRERGAVEEEARLLESEAQVLGSRFASGALASWEGEEARRVMRGKVETVGWEVRIQRLKEGISKMKIDENEAQIRRVRETMDEVYNEGLKEKMVRDQNEFEEMLEQDAMEYVETNREVARRARESVQRDIDANKA
ncbi:hypothetical protein EV356DRAFT_505058 [Viridothelium virens]|uniref:Uncharacterized protein n=1 Tax=Viridothelium virens TaxID=1048519 RepID=A0A6A6H3S1_VIRVR|nr:hypothetical protein EV356DRAFT_505058 [Viridothelium virens]